MSTIEIIQALPSLEPKEQLQIAEAAFHLLQQQQTLTTVQRRQQMSIAPIAAIDDYTNDAELLVFTALDGEDFCEKSIIDQLENS
jgi:hypothetical protein